MFLDESPAFRGNSIAADNCGNLYLLGDTSDGPEIRKYVAGRPGSGELLAEVPVGKSAVVISPDETAVYLPNFDALFALNVATGALDIVAEGGFVPFGPVGGVVVAPFPRGDVDLDDDIDRDDFALWIGCLTGPEKGIDCASAFGCRIADLDLDGDLRDVDAFGANFDLWVM